MTDFTPELETAAKKFQFELKSMIASSVPPPNAPSTIAKKGHGRTLIDTGDYLESIDYRITEDGKGVEIGVFDPEIAEYVYWNEHGTALNPARPVFGPVADGPGERILGELEQDIADKLVSILK